jgi:predicted enzyme related to lactoylglutathione lyase
MLSVSVSIDVPDMAKGLHFYADAFGFSKISEPYPGVAVLRAGNMTITLLEKREQTKPSPNARDVRHYDRHWTPVHLDIHVEDLNVALDRATKAGAIREQFFENAEHGSAAFCSDPFGNGFCLLERKSR